MGGNAALTSLWQVDHQPPLGVIYQWVHHLSYQKGTHFSVTSMSFGGHRKVIEKSFAKDLSKCAGQWEFPIFTMIVFLETAKNSLSGENAFGMYQIYPYCLSFMTIFSFARDYLWGIRNIRNMHYKANPLPIYFSRSLEGQGDIVEIWTLA